MRLLVLVLLGLAACDGAPPDAPVAEYVPSIEAPADVAAPPADATKTESGLAWKLLKSGPEGGAHPGPTAKVEVHYTGWTTDGERFDSSRERGETIAFGLNGVIAGWTEGLQLMKPGDHVRLWIPEDLAYKGKPGKPAGMLVFDVELIEVTEPPKPVPPPVAPPDVAAPPADALKTASGLAYKVVTKGPGGPKPTEKAMVGVHYAGWTTDGQVFDYSRKRHTAATFGLNGVIAGWTEGLQLMEVGDTVRFWIPEELAYKGQPGRPAGMLVFDVELLAVAEPPPFEPPAQVNTSADGIQWVLTSDPSSGQAPAEDAKVKVNWVIWNAEAGAMISNLAQDPVDPKPFAKKVPGIAKAVALLKQGESGRFWIPEELAFAKNPRAPKGALVVDLELVEVK